MINTCDESDLTNKTIEDDSCLNQIKYIHYAVLCKSVYNPHKHFLFP